MVFVLDNGWNMILIRRQSLNPSIPSLEERTNRRERILRRESTISFVDYRTAPCKTVSAIKVLNIRGNFYEVGFNNNMDFKCQDINMGFKCQDINMGFKGQDINMGFKGQDINMDFKG